MFCLYTVFTSGLQAQPWMPYVDKTKSTEQSAGFYAVQKAFQHYWQDREVTRGNGFKQFKRWEYFMVPRVYPSGELPNTILWEAGQEKLSRKKSTKLYNPDWQFCGPDDTPTLIHDSTKGGSGRLNCISFHPFDPDILFAGSPSGGFWKTTDGGSSWYTTTDKLPAIGISDIAVHPFDPDIIYIATGDGDAWDTYSIGILKSIDGGHTWNTTSLSEELTEHNFFRRMLMHPQHPDTMIATSKKGIFRTTDGWQSYELIKPGHFKDLEFKPGDPSVIYTTDYDNLRGYSKIYKSVNTGLSFQECMTGLDIGGKANRIELAVARSQPETVYALVSKHPDSGLLGLYKSTDEGNSWTRVYSQYDKNLLGASDDGLTGGGQAWYDIALEVSPVNPDVIFVGGINIWKSINGGENFRLTGLRYQSELADYIHADHHMFKYSPHDNILFSANDGGLYKTTDNGKTWTDLSDGLHITQVYRIGNSFTNPGLCIAGTQDNGTIMRTSSGWREVLGGDGMECIIDYTDDDIMYATIYYGDLYKITNGGASSTSILPEEDLEGAWVTPVIMHSRIPYILYAGYQDVYRSVNRGYSWTKLSDNLTGGINLRSLAISPVNDNTIYAATYHNIWRTTDGGKSWSSIKTGLPDLAISYITVSPTNPGEIWISLSGYSPGNKVYYSETGGDDWENYSTGLPNVPVNCIVAQEDSRNGLYAGTDIGVYFRDASLGEWEDFNGNLPNVMVGELEIHPPSNKIRAGTYGRGLWETSLNPETADAYADFCADNLTPCRFGFVTFKNRSSVSADSMLWYFGEDAIPSSRTSHGPHDIVFKTLGPKTISLTVYNNGNTYTETKIKYIDVHEEIEFSVIPDTITYCMGQPIDLYATGGFIYKWISDRGDNLEGNKISVAPEQNTEFTVTATNGLCETVSKSLVIVTSNDNVCNALLLKKGFNGPFSNTCATPQENEPVPPTGSEGLYGCNSQDGWCSGATKIDNSIWFRFVVPETGEVSIETEGFDNQIAVYKAGSCDDILSGNYIFLAANDDYPGKNDYSASVQRVENVNPLDTLWLQVDGSYDGAIGIFSITVNDYHLTGNNEKPVVSNAVSLYPNPNTGDFTIETTLDYHSPVRINIYNLNSSMVYSGVYHSDENTAHHKINLQRFPPGIYYAEIITDQEIFREQIVIVN